MFLIIACSNTNGQLVDIEYDLPNNIDNTLKNSTTLYDNAIQWLKEDYKYANRTSPLEGANECPSEITKNILSQEDFDKAFKDFPIKINFDEQMLVLYFFASNNLYTEGDKRLRYYELTHISKQNRDLYIEVSNIKTELLIKDKPYADSTMPTHLCLALLMPKMDIDRFWFKRENKEYYINWKGDLIDNTTVYNANLNWLRDGYKESNIEWLEFPDTITAKIQNHEQYVTGLKKFYDNFDIDKEMLLLYFYVQDEHDKYTYKYSIESINYKYGNLDITINKKKNESKSNSNNIVFLIIKLPQLPAYKVNITIK